VGYRYYEGEMGWCGCDSGACAPLGVKRPKPTPAEEKVIDFILKRDRKPIPSDPWAIAALQMRGRSIIDDGDGAKGDAERQRRIQGSGRGILDRQRGGAL